MNKAQVFKVGGFLIALLLCAALGSAIDRQTAPNENKGVSVKQLSSVDLGPEIEGMGGRQLRMRMITIDPGGFLGIHSHKDRPGAAYVLQGKIINHLGDMAKEYGEGDTWSENKETVHWLENKGKTPAILIAADIFKQP
ncbi:MAG TPA: cupin domain-containing protein [Thermodesulfovibrionales bacterium]|nr:cupin domain-containing protein [Thermodesulfovibrionales bacterium]